MKTSSLILTLCSPLLLLPSQAVVAQSSQAGTLAPGSTLPIRFNKTIQANHVHVGDMIHAKTTQAVILTNGQKLPAGSSVLGHIVAASGFKYDSTPYAKQATSTLSIHFDAVEEKGVHVPLDVYVRAMADPVTVDAALTPNLYDDSLRSRMQVGGDVVTPSQKEIVSQRDDVVGYLKHGEAYAHLLRASGSSPDGCDGGDTEQPMSVFSASACGLYGFTGTSLESTGRSGATSTLTLVSTRRSPEIWANSMALLEVVGNPNATVSELGSH